MEEIIYTTNGDDAAIVTIDNILEHTNADSLEIVMANSWHCCVRKGSFTIGQKAVHIRPDACITPNAAAPLMVEPIQANLGHGGRVRMARLRGEYSHGILLPIDAFKDLDILQFEKDKTSLANAIGVAHWEPPAPTDESILRAALPAGIDKSDELNYQSLTDEELHLGETVLVTRKVDGSSALIYYNPETDNLEICSRSNSYKIWPEYYDRPYLKACMPYIPQVEWLAHYFNQPIAIRGEVAGEGMNGHKNNIDSKKPLGFYMYGIRLPREANESRRMGRYKSGVHFLDINELLKTEAHMKPIPTVDILGEDIISKEMLDKYRLAPASDGEGVVFNGTTFSYKDKSDAYYTKLK